MIRPIFILKAVIAIIILAFVLIILSNYTPEWKSQNESEKKLQSLKDYSYIGGLQEEGGRQYEGYWIKDSVIVYVSASPHNSVYSIDPLIPQPATSTFKVNDSGIFGKSKFAYDSEHLYYGPKLLDEIKPSKFKYLGSKESSEFKVLDLGGEKYMNIPIYFTFFKNGDYTYKVESNCNYNTTDIKCVPTEVID